MDKKLENGCCITAVMSPKSGVTVTTSGKRHDLKDTFANLCLDMLSTGKLSYDDMRSALYAALFTSSATSAFRKSP